MMGVYQIELTTDQLLKLGGALRFASTFSKDADNRREYAKLQGVFAQSYAAGPSPNSKEE